MGLATRLGNGDLESPAMQAVRCAWEMWCSEDPELRVVDEFSELRRWTLRSIGPRKAAVFVKLATLTKSCPEAVTALAWLLVPGAAGVANDLRDLHDDIDGLVAGQLWIECSRAHELTSPKVAGAILKRTRREVCAELGVGDLARRRDRAWAQRNSRVDYLEAVPAPEPEVTPDVDELLMDAYLNGVLVSFDVGLLRDLAAAAHRLDAPRLRGRQGLTSPAVVEAVAQAYHLAPRTLRRRAARALDRLAEFALAREDPRTLASWKTHHPLVPMTAREEFDLLTYEMEWWEIMVTERVSPEAAMERVWRPPGRTRRA